VNRPIVRLGVVAVVAAVLVGGVTLLSPALTSAGESAQAPTRPTRVPLDRATFVCPESSYVSGQTSTDVAAVAAPASVDGGQTDAAGGAAGTPEARLAVSSLGTPTPVASVDRREQVATYAVRKTQTPPLVVTARGSVAPGAVAGQLTRTGTGPLRGLAETPCSGPGAQFWFVGTGSELGRHGRVYLTNTDEGSAQVDLRLYDEKGEVDSDAGRGLTIAAGRQQVVELDKLAPTSKHLAVAVVAQRGRVSAALRDDAVKGETSMGVDWIPSATPPAKEIVVPGVASGDGERVLTIVAPEDSTASVNLSLLAANGSFRPADLGDLEIKPGAVVEVPLQDALRKQAGAVRIDSDVPVTASVRSVLGAGSNPHDVAYSSAARALSGPAVVPDTRGGTGRTSSLLLSSPSQQAVNAAVTLVATDGRQLHTSRVTVRPGSTVELELEPPKGTERYAVVVTPDRGGPLYGTRLLVENAKDGPMVSSWPLATGETTAVRPVARADIGAGIGVEAPRDPIFH
jgi:hypothetical protein